MIGRTNAQISGSSRIAGGDVIVSHSAGAGGMTDHGVVMLQDREYRLLEVKQSGTLTFDGHQLDTGVPVDVCLVGGGANGMTGGKGGEGGEVINVFRMLHNDLIVVVGAGGSGITSVSGGISKSTHVAGFGNTAPITGYNTGGSGGGGGRYNSAGIGLLQSTYPFGDSLYFQPHAGGGGGGGYYTSSGPIAYIGGAGGANGNNGSNAINSGSSYAGGSAGDSSAGAGGSRSSSGSNATYYGGGGGGGGTNGGSSYSGGSGYQGVIWIRIPA